VIQDPLLQKFLQLKSSAVYARRVNSWLLAFFEDQLEGSDSSETKILHMLKSIEGYTQYTKVCIYVQSTVVQSLTLLQILPPACSTYLKSMIPSWNGIVGREVILGLLTYIPLAPFQG
jgi:centromere protein I